MYAFARIVIVVDVLNAPSDILRPFLGGYQPISELATVLRRDYSTVSVQAER